MSAELMAAIADTLLPREMDVPDGVMALPSGSEVPIRLAELQQRHSFMIDAIAHKAGGNAAFIAASDNVRGGVIEAVEKQHAGEFRALLVELLEAYYSAPEVLVAMGWRSEPPQPAGHVVETTGQPTLSMLDAVRQRGAIWRQVR